MTSGGKNLPVGVLLAVFLLLSIAFLLLKSSHDLGIENRIRLGREVERNNPVPKTAVEFCLLPLRLHSMMSRCLLKFIPTLSEKGTHQGSVWGTSSTMFR
jgi:hypothetical protein